MLNLFFWKKSSKGQGALEYLLIIGAAILIAAIVVTILVKTTKTTQGSVDKVYGDFNKVVSDVNFNVGIDDTTDSQVCDSDACFFDKFVSCELLKMNHVGDGSIKSLEILGLDEGFCKVEFLMSDGSESGSEMTCWLEYAGINNNEEFTAIWGEALDFGSETENPKCEGPYYDLYKESQG
jgi:hypothetical protein